MLRRVINSIQHSLLSSLGVLREFYQLVRIVGGGKRLLTVSIISSLTIGTFEAISMPLIVPVLNVLFSSEVTQFENGVSLFGLFQIPTPEFVRGSRTGIMVYLMGLLLTTTLLKTIFDYLGNLALSRALQDFVFGMRTKVFERLLSFGKSYFDGATSGQLYNVVIRDGGVISQGVMEVRMFLSTAITAVVYFSVLIMISWKLTLIGFLVYPIYLWTLRAVLRRVKRTAEDHTASWGELSQAAAEALGSMPLILSYGTEKKESVRFRSIASVVSQLDVSLTKKSYAMNSLQEAFMMFLMVGMALLAYTVLLRANAASGAEYLVFFLVLRRFTGILAAVTNWRVTLEKIGGSLREVLRIFDDGDKYFLTNGTKTFEGLKSEIEFKDVSFSYPNGIPILKNVNFVVPKGQITAIVGPSGAGKSTVMGLLQRLYDTVGGTILYDGDDIREFDFRTIRLHCGVVTQDVFLFNTTLRQNLIYGLEREVSESEMFEVLGKASLSQLVKKLPKGLETRIGERGIRLSGGEKQRLSIARAMLKSCDILLLDEATSALDSETELLIQSALNELMKHRTTVVIAHRLSTIMHADQVLVLEKGQVIEQGPPSALLKDKSRFRDFYDLQADATKKRTGT